MLSTRPTPAVLSVATPGTSSGCRHLPLTSFTTKASSVPEAGEYQPPAPQFPTDGHDTQATTACPPWLSWPRPGTSRALPQVPAEAGTWPRATRLAVPGRPAHSTAIA